MTTDLITKLEQAESGSRELDVDVAAAIGCTKASHITPYKRLMVLHPDGRTIYLPHYTTSIDDALTLVPEGWTVSLEIYSDGTSEACVSDNGGVFLVVGEIERYGRSATPAIPMVIAALHGQDAIKAREAE